MDKPDFEYEIANGKLYLRVLMAERRVFQRWDGDVSLPVEEMRPRVYVSTDPEWQGNVDLGFVKVRGRKYTIEQISKRMPEAEIRHRTGDTSYWTHESSYLGGYRNDRGGRVTYQAKAWDSLGAIEREVLDRFHEEHPEWVKDSTRKLFEYERNHLTSEAKTKRKEADEADEKAAKWQARIDQLGAAE
ncbi:hypothetical protein [Streptomyces sp. NPDC092295]|uniref:hypothetical protein n=1 Tax=Streptomyces sp. NPDC092295 TaxID=3366011 RepID=UPI003810C3B8